MDFRTLTSQQDQSVNFVAPAAGGGAFEARYVRRVADYFIAYLSSHSGCDRACRFCHLTAMGETSMAPALLGDYLAQAEKVLEHYAGPAGVAPAAWVNFNFMARGEPLANPVVLANWRGLSNSLVRMASELALDARLNISTIMPREIERIALSEVFNTQVKRTTLFYSLYSMDPSFRRRWLPKAMDPHAALYKLATWQQETGGEVVLHWAFIAGENADDRTVDEIIKAVRDVGLKARFNLVRYNPYSVRYGSESQADIRERQFHKLADALGDHRSRMVPRVGFDVKASCGMFVGDEAHA
jgi:23S rRNA (adenine2503-C2)-methyltransferase